MDIELEKPLEIEELTELLKNKDVPEVKEKLILHNLRLVNWIAKRYQKDNTPGRELEDLFQEGVIGLMKAIEDYNPNEGSFGNYAALHIKGSILRAITNKSRLIRISSDMVQLINRYKKMSRELEKMLEREPTDMEMSLKLDISLEKVNEIVRLLNNPISLNTIIGGDDNDMTLEDTILDDGPSTEELVESEVFIKDFNKEFKGALPDIQFNSIKLYYGLGCREYSLEEIASKYDVTLKYMSNERQKALRKLRKSEFFRELDEMSSFVRSAVLDQPRVSGGNKFSSPVEHLAFLRMGIARSINKSMDEAIKTDKILDKKKVKKQYDN